MPQKLQHHKARANQQSKEKKQPSEMHENGSQSVMQTRE